MVAGVEELPELPRQRPLVFNVGGQVNRVNATQRPPREPARIERLGHVVLETASFQRGPGLVPGQPRPDRQRLPVLPGPARARPGDGVHPLRPRRHPGRPPHAGDGAGPRPPLRALRLRGGRPRCRGRGRRVPEGARATSHSWGIGRHIEGSQIFDYWRDPDGFLVEHFADGDMFDNTVETGWAQMSASHLNQWGPPVTPDFLAGSTPPLQTIRHLVSALADRDNEFDLAPSLRPAEGGHVMSINLIRYDRRRRPGLGRPARRRDRAAARRVPDHGRRAAARASSTARSLVADPDAERHRPGGREACCTRCPRPGCTARAPTTGRT